MPIIDLSRGGGEGMGVGEARAHFPKQPLVIEPVRHSESKGLMMISASVSVNFFRVVFLYRNSLFVLLTSWSSSDQSKLRLDNFLRQKNTKWVTINQNKTMMVDIWDDWHGLWTKNMQSKGKSFQDAIHDFYLFLTCQVCLRHYEHEFMELACQCPVVVCCRCSPQQKADIVKLLKKHTGKRTCAIGEMSRSRPRSPSPYARSLVAHCASS